MTTQQAIFALLTALLPVLGVILPGIFKQDKLSPQANGVIATVIVVIVAALQAWSEGQIDLINPWLDFCIVLTGISALLAGPFHSVDSFLQSNVGLGSSKQTQPAMSGSPSVLSEFMTALTPLITALQQYTEATKTVQTQPAQTLTTFAAQPVHGPSNVSSSATVQPSQDGAQTSIPAFTSTVEIPVVNAS